MNPDSTQPPPSPAGAEAGSLWLHRASWAVLLAAFPLIFMGGLVTTKGAGMSVPDWPNTYGYNMVLFPPRLWQGGIFFEHSHRLLGMLVGFLAIVQTAVAWGPAERPLGRKICAWAAAITIGLTALSTTAIFVTSNTELAEQLKHAAVGFGGLAMVAVTCWLCRQHEPRPWVRWLTVGLLLGIIVQGVMGGLRVDLVNIELAIVHGIFAQLLVCAMALACVVTNRWWFHPDQHLAHRPGIARFAFIVFAIVSLQLVIGAMMRHYGAGLAVPDAPLIYGKLIPPVSHADLDAANAYRLSLNDPNLPADTTLGKIWLHTGHRIGAILVTIAMVWFVMVAMRGSRVRKVRGPAHWVGILLVAQITLGLMTVWFRKDLFVTTGHHMVGALILLTTFVVGVRAARVERVLAIPAAPPEPPPQPELTAAGSV